MAFYIPIPMQSISIPFHCHSQFCDYFHSHPISMDLFSFPFPCSEPKYYELSLLKLQYQSYADSVSFFHVQ